MSVIQTYLGNVRNAVHRNLRNYMKHDEGSTGKEEFLTSAIAYCQRLLDDPAEPKIKRKRIRSQKGYKTKEVNDA